MQQWLVVYSKPRQEAVAEQHLGRQGYEVYLPRLCRHQQRRGRWLSVTRPMFTRYLFLRAVLGRTNLDPVRSTCGVTGLVSFGYEIKTLPDPIVAAVRQFEGETLAVPGGGFPFQAGDVVRLTDGPLAGWNAIFQAASGEERAFILLELMGRENRVVVPLAYLELSR